MLFVAPLTNQLNTIDPHMTLPLLTHTQRLAQDIATRAIEFASHCGRKTIHIKDVIQASSSVCLACAPFDAAHNTCHLLTTAKYTQIGGGGMYPEWCGGNKQQCGATGNTICLFTGGQRKRHSSLRRMRKQKQKQKTTHTHLRNISHKHCTRRVRTKGGFTAYPGFCGDPSHSTQCMFAENQSVPSDTSTCSGGKHRRVRSHRKSTRGGSDMYTGFCGSNDTDDLLTQCMYGENTGAVSPAACSGGRKRQHSYRVRKHCGGGHAFDSTRLLNKSKLRQDTRQKYNMQWRKEALEVLQNVLSYHVNEVVGRVQEAKTERGARTEDALQTVLASYT